jgi:hypothetical protein
MRMIVLKIGPGEDTDALELTSFLRILDITIDGDHRLNLSVLHVEVEAHVERLLIELLVDELAVHPVDETAQFVLFLKDLDRIDVLVFACHVRYGFCFHTSCNLSLSEDDSSPEASSKWTIPSSTETFNNS